MVVVKRLRRCEPARALGEAIQFLINRAKTGLLRPNAARARNDDPHGLSEPIRSRNCQATPPTYYNDYIKKNEVQSLGFHLRR